MKSQVLKRAKGVYIALFQFIFIARYLKKNKYSKLVHEVLLYVLNIVILINSDDLVAKINCTVVPSVQSVSTVEVMRFVFVLNVI